MTAVIDDIIALARELKVGRQRPTAHAEPAAAA
jgi:hypothetical protein